MKILKGGIEDELKPEALSVMNRLKNGDRVFGSPAQGLKITKKNLEEKIEDIENNKDALDYLDSTGEMRSDLRLLKAGIKGEEDLASFMEQMVKVDEKLQDFIIFASLSDPEQNSGGDDYISDSDFIMIYGNHILIVDAKNIITDPEMPIYLRDNALVSAEGNEILEIFSSVGIWRKIFLKNEIEPETIQGCTVIVNNRGAMIWRNADWHRSNVRPLHISEFVEFLHEWTEGKNSDVSLRTLAIISKMQIKEDNHGMDFSYAKRLFNI